MATRGENALQGKVALRSNIMTVFARSPAPPDDELPVPWNPYGLEKTRRASRRLQLGRMLSFLYGCGDRASTGGY
eukprot:2360175-Pyramimonas_sp.AAC.1